MPEWLKTIARLLEIYLIVMLLLDGKGIVKIHRPSERERIILLSILVIVTAIALFFSLVSR